VTIAENLAAIRGRIDAAAARAGRDGASIRLVGATASFKGVTNEMVLAALAAGLHDFGENRIQEAEQRIRELGATAREATWHFIGHLQTNKAKDAAGLFDIIQSVDSIRLAEQLSARAAKPLGVMLEVNVAGEASKFGFAPGEVAGAATAIARLPMLDLIGLMTVAPAVDNPEAVRPVFRELRELARANGLKELSMGMTDDFEIAIEEGATMIRIGRAIFGERPS
jgi:pyridoxal phosphate enzyme (YggS family)